MAEERKVVARNRRARHDYDILETYEAGLVLTGSEVKSLRAGRASITEAFARPQYGAIWLHGMHIPPYEFARDGGHEPTRPRKLLLHGKEIAAIAQALEKSGLTVVPLELYFRRGLAKVQIGIGRGRKLYDKRQAKAKRDADRAIERAIGRRAKRGR